MDSQDGQDLEWTLATCHAVIQWRRKHAKFAKSRVNFRILDLSTDDTDGHGIKTRNEPQIAQMSADLERRGGHSCLSRREAGPPLPLK